MAGVLALPTARLKLVEALACPSLTVMVIMVLAVTPGVGVIVTVQLEPLPPKTMLALGTTSVFDDVPMRRRALALVSASPIVKSIGPRAVLSGVVWSEMEEMAGGELPPGLLPIGSLSS